MQTQKIFQAGNSQVIALPRSFIEQMGLKVGEKVDIDLAPNGEALVVKKSNNKLKSKNSAANREFEKWWKTFLKENGEILDDLA